ncbi:hypothetical protein PN419_06130 [Halorubrum ezzemoulense]|jgi:hypothetical protein|uniref:Uncharacterized protein n=1 Tax=Halorubrum ezzemoulense TaxID=337243 RepID=A0A238WIS1_HALEZ|nr:MULTISPECIES: hypothetical protein [Halorubrum]MDB2238089.1 hypothetical protein [Halorubrum ezzemoulense]MDB2240258.1 hypothetical protein [Halorubrum ezzemoulense]MDB2247558.1 hypothetical protein [Halorubrum ezzemoulense]MDB2269536.1 hypothetical protein [Halorubrum ezzemoulense]MDB2274706.1 hypothetical protein [Halorubrum ezzemoulense]
MTHASSSLARRSYTPLRSNADMDRQQLMALFFAFLMVSSMVAYGVSLL